VQAAIDAADFPSLVKSTTALKMREKLHEVSELKALQLHDALEAKER